MSRLDREARALVPLDGCAGVVGRRALAAQFVETPARLGALIIESLGKLALLVEGPPVAAIVDRIAEERDRSAMLVEFRNLAESKELRQHSRHDHRDRRATRHVDYRFVLDEILYRNGARRIRVGARQAAKSGAGPDRDDRGGTLHRIL